MDITQILQNLKTPDVDYVPPVTLPTLAVLCFDAGIAPESHWPQTMRSAWFRRLRAARAAVWNMGYGDGSAYLVSQGQEVSL